MRLETESLVKIMQDNHDNLIAVNTRFDPRVCDVCKKKKQRDAAITVEIRNKRFDLCEKHARKLARRIMESINDGLDKKEIYPEFKI